MTETRSKEIEKTVPRRSPLSTMKLNSIPALMPKGMMDNVHTKWCACGHAGRAIQRSGGWAAGVVCVFLHLPTSNGHQQDSATCP
jgi:hypothetical protein